LRGVRTGSGSDRIKCDFDDNTHLYGIDDLDPVTTAPGSDTKNGDERASTLVPNSTAKQVVRNQPLPETLATLIFVALYHFERN